MSRNWCKNPQTQERLVGCQSYTSSLKMSPFSRGRLPGALSTLLYFILSDISLQANNIVNLLQFIWNFCNAVVILKFLQFHCRFLQSYNSYLQLLYKSWNLQLFCDFNKLSNILRCMIRSQYYSSRNQPSFKSKSKKNTSRFLWFKNI